MSKPIDKDYLLSTLKNFDEWVLSNKYSNKNEKTENVEIHTHTNKETIDKLSETNDGFLLFDGKEIINSNGNVNITADTEMSDTSENPVQNKVVKKYVDSKAVDISQDIGNVIETKEDGIYVGKVSISPPDYANEEYGITDTPIGHIIAHMGNNAPKHYLVCDGSEYNITDYPYLAEHFKTEFGSYNYFGGDGVTTFAVPDLQGEFLRGTGINSHENQGSGSDVGEHQDATEIPRTAVYSSTSGFTHQVFFPYVNGSSEYGVINTVENIDSITSMGSYINVNEKQVTDITSAHISSYTTRPANTSVLYCIKYEPTYFMTNQYAGFDRTVLWEGGVPCVCSFNNVTSMDETLELVDDMSNYDTIEINFKWYRSSNGETAHTLKRQFSMLEYEIGDTLWIEYTIGLGYAFSVLCKITSPMSIYLSGAYATGTNTGTLVTGGDGIYIYKITGIKSASSKTS